MDVLALLVMGVRQGRENESRRDASLLASAKLSHLRGSMAQKLASMLLWDLGDAGPVPHAAIDHGGALSQHFSWISFWIH